jgi:hypothetical protein
MAGNAHGSSRHVTLMTTTAAEPLEAIPYQASAEGPSVYVVPAARLKP